MGMCLDKQDRATSNLFQKRKKTTTKMKTTNIQRLAGTEKTSEKRREKQDSRDRDTMTAMVVTTATSLGRGGRV